MAINPFPAGCESYQGWEQEMEYFADCVEIKM